MQLALPVIASPISHSGCAPTAVASPDFSMAPPAFAFLLESVRLMVSETESFAPGAGAGADAVVVVAVVLGDSAAFVADFMSCEGGVLISDIWEVVVVMRRRKAGRHTTLLLLILHVMDLSLS